MIDRIAVVVPAADEQDHIAACLQALQIAAQRSALPARVILVLDSCTDATEQLARGFPDVDVVATAARSVGQARRLGAAHALLEDADPSTLWLASTDADSVVPPLWLHWIGEQARTCDMVVGTVEPHGALAAELAAAWRHQHRLADGHPYVHGANLALSATLYQELGGWRPLATGEDVDLVARAGAAGARIRRSAGMAVRTSARLRGRAPDGFAEYLVKLDHAGLL